MELKHCIAPLKIQGSANWRSFIQGQQGCLRLQFPQLSLSFQTSTCDSITLLILEEKVFCLYSNNYCIYYEMLDYDWFSDGLFSK